MAGYDGYSKSWNAREAEAEGKFPMTLAIPVVAKVCGCTKKQAKVALESVGFCEWHHTSARYNRTRYYCTKAAIGWLAAQPILAALPENWEGEITKQFPPSTELNRSASVDSLFEAFANRFSVSADILRSIYYECWDEVSA